MTMKISNFEDLEAFARFIAELVKQGVCFEADATRLAVELTGGY